MKSFYLVVCLSCLSITAHVEAADGFGQNATGGAGGITVTVTTPQEFLAFVETVDTPYIIQVSGTIELAYADNGRVRIQSNKTLRGIGENPTIIGSLGFKNDCSNVIIERLTITCPKDYTSEEDAISVKERITNVVITKCTLYDSWDGLLDVARKSDWVTVSWCRFFYTSNLGNNNRVSLVGNTDSSGDEGTLHVTFHHNWFGSMCMQRIPSVRYGRGHIYNNYYNCPGNLYCIWSRLHAECLIENNYFKDVNNPYYNIDYADDIKGKIAASGNLLDNCTGTVHPGTDTVFTPPYAYTLDDAVRIPAIVQWGAGADGKDGCPPHWLFGTYGDFDSSGLVDMHDFLIFSHNWKSTSDIADADLNDDGIVNDSELGVFAQNWIQLPADTTAPEAPADLRAAVRNSQAVMDWSINGEEDCAGYHIYRSTTSGGGYVKLNNALLTSPTYTDETVVHGTMYYYVLTAVDISGNESVSSVEACVLHNATTNSIILQEHATGICSIDGIVDTAEHSGYTGYGYIDTTNATGSGINWRINAAAAGPHTFRWRFANGSTDRPARVLINNVEAVSSIHFPATGAWEIWTETALQLTLTEGIQDIRLEALTSGGCANIDYFYAAGLEPEIAICP